MGITNCFKKPGRKRQKTAENGRKRQKTSASHVSCFIVSIFSFFFLLFSDVTTPPLLNHSYFKTMSCQDQGWQQDLENNLKWVKKLEKKTWEMVKIWKTLKKPWILAFTIAKILQMQAPFFKIFACGGLSQLGIDRAEFGIWPRPISFFWLRPRPILRPSSNLLKKKLYFYFFRFFLKL